MENRTIPVLTDGLNEVIRPDLIKDGQAVVINNCYIDSVGLLTQRTDPLIHGYAIPAYITPHALWTWMPTFYPDAHDESINYLLLIYDTANRLYLLYNDGTEWLNTLGATADDYLFAYMGMPRITETNYGLAICDGRENNTAKYVNINQWGEIRYGDIGVPSPLALPTINQSDEANNYVGLDSIDTGMTIPKGAILFFSYTMVTKDGVESNPSPLYFETGTNYLKRTDLWELDEYWQRTLLENIRTYMADNEDADQLLSENVKYFNIYGAYSLYTEDILARTELRLARRISIESMTADNSYTSTSPFSGKPISYENDQSCKGDDITHAGGVTFIANANTTIRFPFDFEHYARISLFNNNSRNYVGGAFWIRLTYADIKDRDGVQLIADNTELDALITANTIRIYDSDLTTPLPVLFQVYGGNDRVDVLVKIPYVAAQSEHSIYLCLGGTGISAPVGSETDFRVHRYGGWLQASVPAQFADQLVISPVRNRTHSSFLCCSIEDHPDEEIPNRSNANDPVTMSGGAAFDSVNMASIEVFGLSALLVYPSTDNEPSISFADIGSFVRSDYIDLPFPETGHAGLIFKRDAGGANEILYTPHLVMKIESSNLITPSNITLWREVLQLYVIFRSTGDPFDVGWTGDITIDGSVYQIHSVLDVDTIRVLGEYTGTVAPTGVNWSKDTDSGTGTVTDLAFYVVAWWLGFIANTGSQYTSRIYSSIETETQAVRIFFSWSKKEEMAFLAIENTTDGIQTLEESIDEDRFSPDNDYRAELRGGGDNSPGANKTNITQFFAEHREYINQDDIARNIMSLLPHFPEEWIGYHETLGVNVNIEIHVAELLGYRSRLGLIKYSSLGGLTFPAINTIPLEMSIMRIIPAPNYLHNGEYLNSILIFGMNGERKRLLLKGSVDGWIGFLNDLLVSEQANFGLVYRSAIKRIGETIYWLAPVGMLRENMEGIVNLSIDRIALPDWTLPRPTITYNPLKNMVLLHEGRDYSVITEGKPPEPPEPPSPDIGILHCKEDGNNLNDGLTWETAFRSINLAMEAARTWLGDPAINNVQIWVKRGKYTPDSTYNSSGVKLNHFKLFNNVQLYGGFIGNELLLTEREVASHYVINEESQIVEISPDLLTEQTVLSGLLNTGVHAKHVIWNDVTYGALDATAVLDGFLIMHGSAYEETGYLTGIDGGGMLLEDVEHLPVIKNTGFYNNHADRHGGGLCCLDASSPAMSNSYFLNNTSKDDGGGIYVANATAMNFINITARHNKASNAGMAMYFHGVTGTLVNNLVANNNSLINDPSAENDGAIYMAGDSRITVVNSTIVANIRESTGNNEYGGIAVNASQAEIYNCILFWNKGSSGVEQIVDLASVLITAANSCIENGYVGTAIIDDNPLLINQTDNYRQTSVSPTIDAGDTALLPVGITTDLDGNTRVVNTIVDIGAYEKQT